MNIEMRINMSRDQLRDFLVILTGLIISMKDRALGTDFTRCELAGVLLRQNISFLDLGKCKG